MTAAAENVQSEFSASGRRRLCLVCRAALHHPHTGRPRVLCRKRNCMREYFRRKKAEAREPEPERWSQLDLRDAFRAWRGNCASCGVPMPLGWTVRNGIVPVHRGCFADPLTDLAKRWLSNCKPGCPLPNPFAGGAS